LAISKSFCSCSLGVSICNQTGISIFSLSSLFANQQGIDIQGSQAKEAGIV
jgi:hypothetical protein